jgi:hypothetical protein
VKSSRETRWAHAAALPEISRLADEEKFAEAFALATKAQKIIPEDPALAKLWPQFSYKISIDTTPPGADVYRGTYARQIRRGNLSAGLQSKKRGRRRVITSGK